MLGGAVLVCVTVCERVREIEEFLQNLKLGQYIFAS